MWKRFQTGQGTSRGLLRDCEIFAKTRIYLYLLSSYCLHPGPLKHILTSVNNDLLNIFIALENPIKKGVIKSFFGAYWTFSAFTWRKHISIMNNDLESWHRLYVHNFEFLGFEQLQIQNMFLGWKYRKVEGSKVYDFMREIIW